MCAKASAASPGIKQRCKYTTLIAIQKSAMKGSVIRSESHATSAVSLFKSREKQSTRRKSKLRSCVQVEVAVLGSPSLIIPMVSVDVKLSWTGTKGKSKMFPPTLKFAQNKFTRNSHPGYRSVMIRTHTHTSTVTHHFFFLTHFLFSYVYTCHQHQHVKIKMYPPTLNSPPPPPIMHISSFQPLNFFLSLRPQLCDIGRHGESGGFDSAWRSFEGHLCISGIFLQHLEFSFWGPHHIWNRRLLCLLQQRSELLIVIFK